MIGIVTARGGGSLQPSFARRQSGKAGGQYIDPLSLIIEVEGRAPSDQVAPRLKASTRLS